MSKDSILIIHVTFAAYCSRRHAQKSKLGGTGLLTRSYNATADRILISGKFSWDNISLIIDIFNAANGTVVDRYVIVPSTYQNLATSGIVRAYSAGNQSAKVYYSNSVTSSSILFITTHGKLNATISSNDFSGLEVSFSGDETQMTEKTF